MTITTKRVAPPTGQIVADRDPPQKIPAAASTPSKSRPTQGMLAGLQPRATRIDLPREILTGIANFLPTNTILDMSFISKTTYQTVTPNWDSARLTDRAAKAPTLAVINAMLDPETANDPPSPANPGGRYNSIDQLPHPLRAEPLAAVASRLVTLAAEIDTLPDAQKPHQFVGIRDAIRKLPMPLRGEPLLALGSSILSLSLSDRRPAIRTFLEDAKKYTGPKIDAPDIMMEIANRQFRHGPPLDMLILAASEGVPGLRRWAEARDIVLAHGQVKDAILAALQPGGSGERWDHIARKTIDDPGLLEAIEHYVAHGPVKQAILAALQPDGSGERWDHIAREMGIATPEVLAGLEMMVAHGPVKQAILAAQLPHGSGKRWDRIARDMGITNPDLLGFLKRAVPDQRRSLVRPGGRLDRMGDGLRRLLRVEGRG